MKKSHLDDYRLRELEVGKQIAGGLLDDSHIIRDPRALYPEYDVADGVALHRPGVNLGSLLFLHPRVLAYVPPMTPAEFPARFGVEYETFLELAFPTDPKDTFIFPILNHPRHYERPAIRQGLTELLIRQPPTWERWHEALRITGGTRWFNEADSTVPYQKLWSVPEFRKVWERRLANRSKGGVSREIKQQIRNNFTDLCLVGFEEEAREIAQSAAQDPYLAIARLFFASEMFAYPHVMGAGGSPHVVCLNTSRMREHLRASLEAGFPKAELMDSEVVETLLEGLEFHNIPQVYRAEFLVAFHRSDQAALVRAAYQKLLDAAEAETPSLDQVHHAIKDILSSLKDFCDSSEGAPAFAAKTATERQTTVTVLCAIGGVLTSVGGFFIHPAVGVAAGTLFSILGAYPVYTREKIERQLLERYCPGVPFELLGDYQKLKDFRASQVGELAPIQEPSPLRLSGSLATSVRARALWWKKEEG